MAAQLTSGTAASPSLGGSLSWAALSLHVLQPKAVVDLMDGTPFASGLLHSADGYASPLAASSHHPPAPRSRGTARGVRRSLSAGLGLAGAAAAAESPQDSVGYQSAAPYMMARFSASSAVSRYFSVGDSEFEDATSDIHDGERKGLLSKLTIR